MGIFNFLKKRTTETTDLTNPKQWLLDILGGDTSSGQSVTEETSLKFTGVWSAVDLRSSLLASMPVNHFRIDDGKREALTDELYIVLAYRPNPYMNAFDFWSLINSHLDLWGNAYCVITKSKGKLIALSPIHPSKVVPDIVDGQLVYKTTIDARGGYKPSYSPNELLHFRGLSTDGLIGKSPIRHAAEAIGVGLAAEKFGASFFNGKGHSKGVLEMDGSLDEKSREAFAKAWKKNVDHGTPLLEYGIKYKELSIPPDDAQFLGTREFSMQDIARIYHIPPSLLGDLSRSTFSNIEHSDIQFVKYGLRPMVKRYEKELELKLLPDKLGKETIRFNLDGILRGDTASRGAFYSQMRTNKIMTANEIRSLENLNPIEGGDILENPATSKSEKNEQGN